MRTVDSPIGIPSLCSSTHIRCAVQHCFGAQRESHSFSLSHFSMCGRAASRTGVLCSAWRWYRRSLGAGSSRRSLATVLRERPNWLAAARWLLPWIKTQVRISSRSATGYTFPYLRSLEFAFEYSGVLGPVAHFWVSEWLTRMIAFTALANAHRRSMAHPPTSRHPIPVSLTHCADERNAGIHRVGAYSSQRVSLLIL